MGTRHWLTEREIGNIWSRMRHVYASPGQIASQLLSKSIACYGKWDPVDIGQHGGVFNLAFSPDGSLLAAACERKAIILLDPLNIKLVARNANSHTDCVNCVRFLDSRMLVSCSDDTTIRLWDARFMRHCVRTLTGHFKWVKNIEHASESGLLVTSGFDGSVHTWDFNSYSEEKIAYRRVFHMSGLMRMKLSPDASRMVIATNDGHLIVIHDLDLETMAADLVDFKPGVHNTRQQHRLSTQRLSNRVELITDFPRNDDAETIASLEVHPQGWCAVSRNSCRDGSSEWTCIHDIQGPSSIKDHHTDSTQCKSRQRSEINTTMHNHENGPDSTKEPIVDHKFDETDALSQRLLFYIQEPNVGRGFIKEMSFNMDGRLLASPFAYGIRLLAFDDACSELCDCVDLGGHIPRKLNEVARSISHPAIVATVQFSPTNPQIVAGCLDGSIGFHRPLF